MQYPQFLKAEGTIGFVAPAFGCTIEPYHTGFSNAQEKWKTLGYQINLGPNCYRNNGIGISSTPEECGKEIMDYYCSKDNDCLISCGGGELMCEILDFVDFDMIRQSSPKWFMGYSDNTNMTFLLATLCDTASVYGPCAAAFGMEPWHESLQDAMDILTGKKLTVKGYDKWEKESLKDAEHPLEPYHVTERRMLRKYIGMEKTEQELEFSGRLLGGCMDCLVNLTGTVYDRVEEFAKQYQDDGIIWFLESCDLNVMSIRRAMWQMEHAGWFQYTKGFLIGRAGCYGEDLMGLDAYDAVVQVAGKYNVPIVMDADIGHLPPMMPLVTGSYGAVKVHGNDITVDMKLY